MHFTVIIPCFNASKTISRALDSLVNQTFTNFDVVMVDDASVDYLELIDAINAYNTSLKITVIRNSENKNGAYSRNRAIEVATGEYVAFLDADDSWVEDRLALAVDLINNIKDKDFVVYGRFELLQHHASGSILPLRGIRPNELVSEYVFAAGQSMQTSTFICPLKVARDVLFDESYSRHQDTDFMMRAQSKGISLIFQNQKCSNYYIKPSDIVSRIKEGRINRVFCKTWLHDKFMFFNDKSYAGYRLIVYSRVLYLENYVLKAFAVAFSSAPKIGFKNLIDLIHTKTHIIKSRLAWIYFLNSHSYIYFSEFSNNASLLNTAFFI
jgi:amylovoran biosynthesis glycosyltransferase AmsB